MNRPLVFRGLRIAVTFVFVVFGALLMVLWARSYLGRDYLNGYIAPANRYEIHSANGTLIFLQRERVFISFEFVMEYPEWLFANSPSHRWSGVEYHFDGSFTAIFVSYWLLTLMSIAAAAAPGSVIDSASAHCFWRPHLSRSCWAPLFNPGVEINPD